MLDGNGGTEDLLQLARKFKERIKEEVKKEVREEVREEVLEEFRSLLQGGEDRRADQPLYIEDVSEKTGLSVSTIRTYKSKGCYSFPEPVSKRGNRPVWSRKDIDEWQLSPQAPSEQESEEEKKKDAVERMQKAMASKKKSGRSG